MTDQHRGLAEKRLRASSRSEYPRVEVDRASAREDVPGIAALDFQCHAARRDVDHRPFGTDRALEQP
jgi:hypothetical protein